ncbi:MAG: hypothetical protein WBC47_01500 [Dehalococcoidia bacterium]
MRVLGAFLLVCGFVVAIGYLLDWFFSAVAESSPMPLKVAIVAAAIGLLLLFISIGRERYKASKKEEFKEVER